MSKKFRVFATCDIGESIELLRKRGYDVEVYPNPEAPPKSLIIEKVKSGIDGLITTLRDPIDAEIFEAGKGTLKVVAQIAVGFDNINRADANRYKVPFTHTADVLTEATAEFAFFMLGALARKMWSAEHLTRENKWGYWHPYLPFLGDEVTGKTIAVIGTGRIGLALIKKCTGFDMNILCYDPAYQNHEYVKAIQEMKDLRQARGIQKEKTWIKYVSLRGGVAGSGFCQRACAAAARRREHDAYLSPVQRKDAAHDEADGLSGEHVAGAGGGRGWRWPRRCGKIGLPGRRWMCTRRSRCRRIRRCAIRRLKTAAGCCRILPARRGLRGLSTDPNKGMAGRAAQGLIDVLEGNYGGDVTKMPYVVNKEGVQVSASQVSSTRSSASTMDGLRRPSTIR